MFTSLIGSTESLVNMTAPDSEYELDLEHSAIQDDLEELCPSHMSEVATLESLRAIVKDDALRAGALTLADADGSLTALLGGDPLTMSVEELDEKISSAHTAASGEQTGEGPDAKKKPSGRLKRILKRAAAVAAAGAALYGAKKAYDRAHNPEFSVKVLGRSAAELRGHSRTISAIHAHVTGADDTSKSGIDSLKTLRSDTVRNYNKNARAIDPREKEGYAAAALRDAHHALARSKEASEHLAKLHQNDPVTHTAENVAHAQKVLSKHTQALTRHVSELSKISARHAANVKRAEKPAAETP